MDKRKSKDKLKSKVSIIDLNDYRKNKNEERRREYERVLFNRILGVYSFAEKTGLHHVEVIDISYSGIKFREDSPEHPLKIAQKIALRFYFTPSSYLRLVVDVKRSTPFKEEDREGLEYGCELDKNTKSYDVIRQLISFMYKYAEIACQDSAPPMIWF
jgi:PilZ domain